MAVDLFALRMNLQTTGTQQATTELRAVDQQGTKTAASLGGVAQGMNKVSVEAKATETATSAVSSRLGLLGNLAADLGPLAIGAGAGFLAFAGILKATAPEADAFRLSALRLDGAARLTGTSLGFLQGVSRRTQQEFRLSAIGANEFTAEVAKLTGKAGDLSQTSAVLAAFLNVGAAQGLTARQTLVAVHQAILGIDEGTDKLFQKNPSVIYKEFAERIGTTAGKLTDQQKAQALVNEVMESAVKVGDAYSRFLGTAAGQSDQLATASERLQANIGKLFEPLRAAVSGTGARFINWLSDVAERMSRINQVGSGTMPLFWFFARFFRATVGGEGATSDWDPGEVPVAGHGASIRDEPFVPPAKKVTAADRAAIKAEQERILGLANMDESLKPAASLPFQGVAATTLATRGALDVSGSVTAPNLNRPGIRFMDQLRQDLFEGLQRLQPFQFAFQGFMSQLFAGGNLKASIKRFGQDILAGMGSIFARMAAKAIAAAPIFQAIGAAMRNPFTAGFALLAFGIALKALAASMGGTATGGGESGAGGFTDRTTNITLTANDAGGLTAPNRQLAPNIHVLGVHDPEGQRIFGQFRDNTVRRGI